MSRQMKASGVSWMGSVPATWTPIRADSLFTKLKRVQHNQKVLSLSYGKIINKKVTNDGLVPANYDTYQGVNPGDIVLRLTDLQNDEKSIRVAHSDITGIITSAYLSLKAKKVVLPLFGYFLLHTAGDINKLFYSLGGGVRQTMKFNDIARLSFVIPSFKEQVAITKYLDDRTTAIDSKIQLLEEKSKSLAELRKSVVHQAVTKGLNANVAMKSSGTFNIPSHWQELRADRHFFETVGRATSDGEVLTCSIEHGIMPQEKFTELTGRRLSKPLHEKDNYKRVEKGDFVYNKMRMWQGAVSLSEYDGVVSPAYIVLRAKYAAANKFYHWVLKSDYFVEQAGLKSYGICDDQNSLRYCDFKTLIVFTPPVVEQIAIATYLDERTAIIDESIKTIADQISAMKSLRQSLIHEAVTGKIDVADYGYHYA